MTDHVITVEANGSGLSILCSCGVGLCGSKTYRITLDTLTEIADEHIRSAEKGVVVSGPIHLAPGTHTLSLNGVVGEGYGTKSALTSEDTMVDLDDALLEARMGDDFRA